MYQNEEGYLYMIEDTLENGKRRPTRVGYAFSRFAPDPLVFDLADGFPIITTRKIFWRPVLGELAAFLQGADHVEAFRRLGCNYWNKDAERWNKQGFVGRIYGVQWRGFNRKTDQLLNLVNGLIHDPYGRRHIVTAWNPSELHEMCLPPCHIFFQMYADPVSRRLDMTVYMRSVDLCLGLPSDLVLYGAMLHLIAKEVEMLVGTLTFQFGDAHVYENHAELAKEQIGRPTHARPRWAYGRGGLFLFDPVQAELIGYRHDEAIGYPLNTEEVSA